MRLTFIFAVVIAATLHASGASHPSTQDGNAVVANGDLPAIVDTNHAERGRLLRRVD
ncbi:hypothetical protein PR003_g22580 [Phytophthora rubi]|uniref:RxLR effector protein n=1 Tax=Phytophthora rubi TaxID=129364 RepID=A0A6A4DBX7_9STRA|nr:hypothetical protein PR001_g22441 [Phytophthora rubi]KAE8987398.1 hypothetical protein PR002_g22065 [Phytophthora rubi]KAE9301198.1 hypothetical protein PR003_g22580 [Phytophthora rubi]